MKTLIMCTLLALSLQLTGVEAAPAANAETSPWSHHLKLGFFLNTITTANADTSNDATIGGANDSATYTLNLDGRLKWKEGKNTVQQDLIMKYGRKYDETTKWQENTDEIDYDGTYTHNIATVHNYYTNVGFDTVFTGPDEDESSLDPFTGKISAGYKFSRENILPIKDAFFTRTGVRAQRTWGDNASEEQKDTQTGIEWVTRYERKQTEQLNYFAQYEFFTEFDDTAHHTHLLKAGLNYKITPIFSIKFDIRAYYETEPEEIDAAANNDTYGTLSIRQETMVGFTYEF